MSSTQLSLREVEVVEMDMLLHIYTPATSMVAECGHRCPDPDDLYGIPVDLGRRHCAECVRLYTQRSGHA